MPRRSSTGSSGPARPASPSSATETAYSGLRSLILEGTYPLGARLGENELADVLGVSRTPVREALSRLSSEGLVEVLPNRGARVATWSPHDLENIYEIRALIESHAASRAAQTVRPADLDRLSELCSAEEAEVRRPEPRLGVIRDLNRDFHSTIVYAVPNEKLQEIVISLVDFPSTLLAQTASSGLPTLSRLKRNLVDHVDLVDALRARDGAWAGAVMRSHMLGERATLLRERKQSEGSEVATAASEPPGSAPRPSSTSVSRRRAGRSAD
jgi:DNA-binding GntR family transcriptional regulator